MTIRHLHQRDYKVMPWKNGKGRTSEIEIRPHGATLINDDFIWRLSSAEVEKDGSFSQFPGCDRILTILEGHEMTLEFEDQSLIAEPGSVLRFSGESKVHGKLSCGKIRDWNFIFKKDSCIVNTEYHSKELSGFPMEKGTYIVFICSGSAQLKVGPQTQLSLELFATAILDIEASDNVEACVAPQGEASFLWTQITEFNA